MADAYSQIPLHSSSPLNPTPFGYDGPPLASRILYGDSTAVTKLMDGIFLGGIEAGQDLEFCAAHKITHIVNCSGASDILSQYGLKYLSLRWIEGSTGPGSVLFDPQGRTILRLFKFIESGRARGEGVLVHSVDGNSRAVGVVMGYLMRKFRWGMTKCLEYIRLKRPGIHPSPVLLKQLARAAQFLNLNPNDQHTTFAQRWCGAPLPPGKESHQVGSPSKGTQLSNTETSSALQALEQLLHNTFLNGHAIAVVAPGQEALAAAAARSAQSIAAKEARARKRIVWADEPPPPAAAAAAQSPSPAPVAPVPVVPSFIAPLKRSLVRRGIADPEATGLVDESAPAEGENEESHSQPSSKPGSAKPPPLSHPLGALSFAPPPSQSPSSSLVQAGHSYSAAAQGLIRPAGSAYGPRQTPREINARPLLKMDHLIPQPHNSWSINLTHQPGTSSASTRVTPSPSRTPPPPTQSAGASSSAASSSASSAASSSVPASRSTPSTPLPSSAGNRPSSALPKQTSAQQLQNQNSSAANGQGLTRSNSGSTASGSTAGAGVTAASVAAAIASAAASGELSSSGNGERPSSVHGGTRSAWSSGPSQQSEKPSTAPSSSAASPPADLGFYGSTAYDSAASSSSAPNSATGSGSHSSFSRPGPGKPVAATNYRPSSVPNVPPSSASSFSSTAPSPLSSPSASAPNGRAASPAPPALRSSASLTEIDQYQTSSSGSGLGGGRAGLHARQLSGGATPSSSTAPLTAPLRPPSPRSTPSSSSLPPGFGASSGGINYPSYSAGIGGVGISALMGTSSGSFGSSSFGSNGMNSSTTGGFSNGLGGRNLRASTPPSSNPTPPPAQTAPIPTPAPVPAPAPAPRMGLFSASVAAIETPAAPPAHAFMTSPSTTVAAAVASSTAPKPATTSAPSANGPSAPPSGGLSAPRASTLTSGSTIPGMAANTAPAPAAPAAPFVPQPAPQQPLKPSTPSQGSRAPASATTAPAQPLGLARFGSLSTGSSSPVTGMNGVYSSGFNNAQNGEEPLSVRSSAQSFAASRAAARGTSPASGSNGTSALTNGAPTFISTSSPYGSTVAAQQSPPSSVPSFYRAPTQSPQSFSATVGAGSQAAQSQGVIQWWVQDPHKNASSASSANAESGATETKSTGSYPSSVSSQAMQMLAKSRAGSMGGGGMSAGSGMPFGALVPNGAGGGGGSSSSFQSFQQQQQQSSAQSAQSSALALASQKLKKATQGSPPSSGGGSGFYSSSRSSSVWGSASTNGPASPYSFLASNSGIGGGFQRDAPPAFVSHNGSVAMGASRGGGRSSKVAPAQQRSASTGANNPSSSSSSSAAALNASNSSTLSLGLGSFNANREAAALLNSGLGSQKKRSKSGSNRANGSPSMSGAAAAYAPTSPTNGRASRF